MNLRSARLLGFAPLTGLTHLRAALNGVPGAAVATYHGSAIAAFLQPEPDDGPRDSKALAADLLTVQRRLEVGCQAGPFLPMDPEAAVYPAASVSHLLDQAWDKLSAALAEHGACHQWDVTLRWAAEPNVVRRRGAFGSAIADAEFAETAAAVTERDRREAALLAVLARGVRAYTARQAVGSENAVTVTVLLDAGGESAMEAALDALPATLTIGADIFMRGPLPPVDFAAVRLAYVDASQIARAWRILDLPDRASLASLHRHWGLRAATVHPDRQPTESGVTVADLTRAYRLLRPLLRDAAGERFLTRNSLLSYAGQRLIMPEEGAAPVARPQEGQLEMVL